jgi:hypothetical protein
MPQGPRVPEGVDLEHPNVARVYDYLLGGTANWAIDRFLADQLSAAVPIIRTGARVNREFLGRAVRYSVKAGITQFLDLGSGVPTVGNVHEVADELDSDSRCVYVDCEPVAVAHARVLLEDNGDPMRHAVLHADMRDVRAVWTAAMATGVLDPAKPIGLLMVSVLHWLHPQEGVPEMVETYKRLLPTGSHMTLTHCTLDAVPEEELAEFNRGVELYNASGNYAYPRHTDHIRTYFDGLDLVEPGLVWLPEWHVDDGPARATALLADRPAACCFLGGIGVKP